jgi:hypothetical protein
MTKTKNSARKPNKGQQSGPLKMDTAERAWLSSVLLTEDTDSTPRTVSPQELEKWSVYTSLDALPFSVYVDCACTGEYGPLSTAKIPAPEIVLHAGWQNIQRQFNEAVGGDRMEQATILSIEIEKLNLDIDRVQLLIDEMLRYGDNDSDRELLADQLREEGFDAGYSAESYREDLRITALHAKRFVLQREIKMKEAEGLLPPEGSSEAPTRETFIKCLVRISQHSKYNVQMKAISTLEFCVHYRDYLDYVESIKTRPAAAPAED